MNRRTRPAKHVSPDRPDPADRMPQQLKALAEENAVLRRRIAELEQAAQSSEDAHRSEERYRSLFDNMLEGFSYCKMLYENGEPQDFVYLEVNEAFERLAALKNVVGRRVSEVIPGIRQSNPELFEIYNRVALTGQPERFETYVSTLGIWFSISVYSPGQEYFVAVFDNITARKRAEEALRESEARFRRMVETATEGICTIDAAATIDYVNRRGAQIVGYTVEEMVGRSPLDFFFPEETTEIAPSMGEHSIPAGTGEYRIKRKDGSTGWVYASFSLVFDGQNDYRGILTMFTDITDHKQTEATLHTSEERYRSLFEQVPVALWEEDFSEVRASFQRLRETGVSDFRQYFDAHPDEVIRLSRQAKIRDVNRYTLELYEADSKAALLQGLNIVFGPESHEVFKAELVALAEGANQYQAETVDYTLRGEPRYINLRLSVPAGYEGTLARVLVSITDITERKRAEEALRESEAKLRSVIEQSWDGICLTDERGRVVEWNQRAEQITGLARLEAIGRPIWDVQFRLAPVGQRTSMAYERLRASIQSLLESGQSPWLGKLWNAEVQLLDGTHRFIEQSVFTVETDKGYMLCGILRDVTERQQTEAEIARLAVVVDQAAESIIVTDLNANIVYANRFFETVTGYAVAEVLGRNPRILKSGFHDRAFYERLWATITSGETWNGRLINRCKDGSLYYEDATIFPIKDKAGRIINYAAVKRDVTERQQQEREMEAIAIIATALRAAPSRAEMMPVILHQMIRIMHLDGAALALKNARTGELMIPLATGDWTGWTGQRLTNGAGLTSRVVNTRQPFVSLEAAADQRIDGVEQLGQLGSVMCVPLIESGTAFGALWIGHRAPNSFVNNELRWLTAIADIAANALHRATVLETLERRVAERTRELQAANEQLTELDRMKDQFVSNVSHELRTPLTSIRLYLELLTRGKPEKHSQYIEQLERETQRLTRLIEDLLELSRLEVGTLSVTPAAIDVNALVSQLVSDRENMIAGRSLHLITEPGADLPPALADAARLEQVISNLITNAMNYTPAGGAITVKTERRDRDEAEWITLTVEDTGPGVSANDLPHLFERFYRGEAGRKSGAPGTGLGLSICLMIIEKLNGRITVDSPPDHGAIFTVWLRPASLPPEV